MKKIFFYIFILILICQTNLSSYSNRTELLTDSTFKEVELGKYFVGMEGTFVLLNINKNEFTIYNKERALRRFVPASTFKIPNSIIALENNILIDENSYIEWDSITFPPTSFFPDAWRKGQTLKSAFRNSTVWYYKTIAKQIGEKIMSEYLERFNYGNQDISDGIDKFWLTGGLSISPFEQINFLKRFYLNELGLSAKTNKILKYIMLLEENENYSVYGKTGTMDIKGDYYIAWLVGFIETKDNNFIYVLNIEGELVWDKYPPSKRLELVKNILTELNIIY